MRRKKISKEKFDRLKEKQEEEEEKKEYSEIPFQMFCKFEKSWKISAEKRENSRTVGKKKYIWIVESVPKG